MQDNKRESQEHTKDRRGLQTGSTGPDKASKSSFEIMTPRAKVSGICSTRCGVPGHHDTWRASALARLAAPGMETGMRQLLATM